MAQPPPELLSLIYALQRRAPQRQLTLTKDPWELLGQIVGMFDDQARDIEVAKAVSDQLSIRVKRAEADLLAERMEKEILAEDRKVLLQAFALALNEIARLKVELKAEKDLCERLAARGISGKKGQRKTLREVAFGV